VTLLIKTQPDEFYNLAAQSHVHTSFELPVYTSHVDGIGTLNCLEAIRQAGLAGKTKFYQVCVCVYVFLCSCAGAQCLNKLAPISTTCWAPSPLEVSRTRIHARPDELIRACLLCGVRIHTRVYTCVYIYVAVPTRAHVCVCVCVCVRIHK